MDPSSFFSSFLKIHQIFNKKAGTLKLITPFFWVCSYFPSLVFAIASVWIIAKTHMEGEIQCLGTSGFPKEYVQVVCLRMGFSITNSEELGIQTVSPGVGGLYPGVQVRTREFSWVLQPILVLCAVTYLVAPKLWKFIFEGNRVREVVLLMESSATVRPEDFRLDEQRRHADAAIALECHLFRRGSFARKMILCEVILAITGAAVWYLLLLILGDEFTCYGYDAIFDPFRYDPTTRIEDLLFPHQFNCQLSKFGPSGNMMPVDTFCFYPPHATYRTVFVGLWFIAAAQPIVSSLYVAGNLVFCGPAIRGRYFAVSVPPSSIDVAMKVGEIVDFSGFIYIRYLLRNLSKPAAVKVLQLIVPVWESLYAMSHPNIPTALQTFTDDSNNI